MQSSRGTHWITEKPIVQIIFCAKWLDLKNKNISGSHIPNEHFEDQRATNLYLILK